MFTGPKGSFPPKIFNNSFFVFCLVQLDTNAFTVCEFSFLADRVENLLSSAKASSPMHFASSFQNTSSTIPIATWPSRAGKIPNGASSGCPFPSGPGIVPSKSCWYTALSHRLSTASYIPISIN